MMQVTINVNGEDFTRDVEPRLLLIHFLRDQLRLTGSHWGCDTTNCGVCVVWMDGEPVKSCTVLTAMANGRSVRTVEDLEQGGELSPIQQGFMNEHGLQCGFCTPAMMMTGQALLDRNPDPSNDRDPRSHLRHDLPLHRVREHRASHPLGGARRGRHRANQDVEVTGMTVTDVPTSAAGNPIGFGRMLRKEDARFLRGQGHYIDDMDMPGMLHGAILRSPVAHALIKSIDTSAAEAHPKVKAVITGAVLEGARPGVGADAVVRHGRRARHRQGPLPGPRGRLRRSPRTSTRLAMRWS